MTTLAERVLDLAEMLLADGQIVASPEMSGEDIARAKLAMDFYRRPSVLHFRAIAEDWDLKQLIREVY